MSKIDVVRAAMVEAMKAKDKARKDSLSMLLSALKNAEIDKREPLTEDGGKRRREKGDQADPGDHMTWLRPTVTDIRERSRRRGWRSTRNLLREDMRSEQISRGDRGRCLRSWGSACRPSAKDKGTIMKVLMPRVKGKGRRKGGKRDTGRYV